MKILVLLTMITFGTSFQARAAAQDPGATTPQCQSFTAEDGATSLVCENLSDKQSLNLLSQDPTAFRRCFRVCNFRVGPLCFGYHVECRHWHGGYWNGGYWNGGY